MARLTNLDDVLFPVDEHPIFVSIKDPAAGERRTFIPNKKAIVHDASNRVLGVVGRSYRLVTNHQALDWGFQCCRSVFPETDSGEWEVRSVDAPSTASYCRIDLVHNLATLNFSLSSSTGGRDVFGPFIRVTNSYNGLRALAFDIGFVRMICTNGLIFPEEVIKFKFTHLRRDIPEEIRFHVSHERLNSLKDSFCNYIAALRDCPIPHKYHETFVQGVLGLRSYDPFSPNTRDNDDWDALSTHIADLCSRYAAELGENAYAIFNAVTEFASNPPANRLVCRERHSFQRSAGEWVSSFSKECAQSTFNLAAYLSRLSTPKQAETVN